MFQEFTGSVLLIFTGLFPIVNPPASALIMLSLVPHATPAERAELATRITINSFILLLVSLSIGAYVLSFFGISIPILRVAGGIIVASAGWNLLQSPEPDDNNDAGPLPDHVHAASLGAKAFYPLTLPLTVGPGSIAVAIALGTGSPREGLSSIHLLGVGVGLLLLCSSVYLCMRFAVHVEHLLGKIGTQVAMRLFAFVIFCIGVQIFWLGLSELIGSLHLH